MGDRVGETARRVIGVLEGLRFDPCLLESEIHDAIAGDLTLKGIEFEREVEIGPRCRIDFLCEGGVGIEVKKGKVGSTVLGEQAARYCACESVAALILAVEDNAFSSIHISNGKTVYYVGLSMNWGIAL